MRSDVFHPHPVLDFWFGAKSSAEYGRPRELWFVKKQARSR